MHIPSLTNAVTYIQNPNLPLGTLIEEIPSDIGRSVQGYKRGGFIEGAEKFRKEVMSAAVWLGGIPLFKYLGDKVFEKIFNVPMKVEFSNKKDGNDAISDTLRYIYKGENYKGLDISDLPEKYIKKFRGKNLGTITSLAKKVSIGKKLTSTAAVIINCVLMGIVLPKINQKITRNKLKEQREKAFSPKISNLRDYALKTRKNDGKPLSFTGFFDDVRKLGMTYAVGYNTENSNRFRLISTDVPMIIGRTATSRNGFEGFENFFTDSSSIFFYNYCTPVVQKALRTTCGLISKKGKIPDILPKVSDYISELPENTIKLAIKKIGKSPKNISEIFSEDIVENIYRRGTFEKYKKINKFVKNSDIEDINKSVINYLEYLKKVLKNESNISSSVKKITKNINKANASFLGAGLFMSIMGLSYIIPKTTFFITRKITGKNTFPGITVYDKKTNNKKEV